MFRYRLHSPDGDDLGEATYAMMIKSGEEGLVGNGRRSRVLDVFPLDPEDDIANCMSAGAARRAATGRGGLARTAQKLRD